MAYKLIDVIPLSGALGAEVHGVDLADKLSGDLLDEIRQACVENLVIFFRNQALSPEQHMAFGRHFGALHTNSFFPTVQGYKQIQLVAKGETDTRNIGDVWHSDVPYEASPPLGSVLYCHEAPPFGGDTMFANMYLAYETLSASLRSTLRQLRAVNSGKVAFGKRNISSEMTEANKSMRFTYSQDAEQEAIHPVVRTHPETGRDALYINKVHTMKFEGWTEQESKPLLDFLHTHQARPEFTCRFNWQPGSLAFWDNRCTHHNAINDYQGYRRLMHRITVLGDQPFLTDTASESILAKSSSCS